MPHVDNLGIYELVRRRCARIICVDAGTNPECTLADLGKAVQKCRVDFGKHRRLDVATLGQMRIARSLAAGEQPRAVPLPASM
jgi:hypothetical protein